MDIFVLKMISLVPVGVIIIYLFKKSRKEKYITELDENGRKMIIVEGLVCETTTKLKLLEDLHEKRKIILLNSLEH